ncbi:CLUMA_CG000117, isoform A, partial [Clunio marinus]
MTSFIVFINSRSCKLLLAVLVYRSSLTCAV